ncbi:MAG: dihydropteroate synthase [Candidatus Lernaella stagnicola]|nr:dihydropteroate synthase [Candidatus Lernaella stagnicola]
MIRIADAVSVTDNVVARAVDSRDTIMIRSIIQEQIAAGCDYLDLHAGWDGKAVSHMVDDLVWLVYQALEAGNVGLCLDNPNPEVIAQVAPHVAGKRKLLINSSTAGRKHLGEMLDLALEHDAGLIVLASDDSHFSLDPQTRLAVCRKIYLRAMDAKLPPERLFLDAIAMPLVSYPESGQVMFEVLRAIKDKFPHTKACLGLSNLSFGRRHRRAIHRACAALAVWYGVDAMIMDCRDKELARIIEAATLVAGLANPDDEGTPAA